MNELNKEKKTINYEGETFNVLRNDKDMFKEYQYYFPNGTQEHFENVLRDCLEYCFNSEFDPFLDKKYIDCAWLQIEDKIINIDDIYDDFRECCEYEKEEHNM